MRPVIRGAIPLDGNGQPLVFTDYKEARDPLIARLGDYCSYCEMPCSEGPDVERVRPKGAGAGSLILHATGTTFCSGASTATPSRGRGGTAGEVLLARQR